MSMQQYGTVASRNLIRAEMEMLKHAEPIVVLGSFGTQKEQPKRKTDTIVFRRVLPFGASTSGTTMEGVSRYRETPVINPNSFLLSEGVTPNSNTISYVDVSVTLQNYGVLFKFSSKAELMYEDDIPSDMSQQTGEVIAEMSELIRYGVIKGGTNVLYSNGSARTSVNTPISLAKLRNAARTLEANRARRVTQRLASGPNFGTAPVEGAYLVFCHTDCEADVRNLSGFTKVAEYASVKPAHEREIGAVENFRFITSPLLGPYLAGGASVGSSGMLSVGATSVDVYPFLVIAQDAWANVALKGMGAVSPTVISSQTKNHANPLGLYGFVGASFWMAAVRLNEAYLVRIEAGVTTL